jgi:TonB family protein
MSAMARHALLTAVLAETLILAFLSIPPLVQGQDVEQHLRDQYQGKTFVLRGFYSGDRLRYDASGAPDSAVSGGWTTDGFVRVNEIHISDDRLIIKGQRMAAAQIGGQFQLRPLERKAPQGKGVEDVWVEIEADPDMHNPALEQVDALFSKIFLTAQDSLADLVPDYWKPCLAGKKMIGAEKHCFFAPEVLTIPGVAVADEKEVTISGAHVSAGGVFLVGGGVSPPRVTYQRDPEFSDPARAAKFQGVVTLLLVVDKEGAPNHVRISQPLGYGLDEKAVQAVSEWKFKPAEKDGMPVNVEIAVEVDFHLY